MSENFVNNAAIKADQELPIRFAPDFSTRQYQLFEIGDNDLLEKILASKEVPTIKNFVPGDEINI